MSVILQHKNNVAVNTADMKALVIFHRADFDGLFSYAISRTDLEEHGYDVTGFGWDYNDGVAALPDWDDYDKIVMCDISLPVDIMKELYARHDDKVSWIDHHITAIQNSAEHGYSGLAGIRDTENAACVLTYMYFHPECIDDPYSIPAAVRYAGANDIWDQKTYDWDGIVQPLQYGLSEAVQMNAGKMIDLWEDILFNTDKYIMAGRAIKSYMESQFSSWVGRFAFEVKVDDRLKGIAMICPMFSSRIFKSVIADYDICIVVQRSNKSEGVFNVSMYAGNAGIDFSCSQYMKDHYNGGGHKGAAGGTLNKDQFDRLIMDCKI